MDDSPELQGVEIEFAVDWYDGPLTGIAGYDGDAYWFEAETGWDPGADIRLLRLFPLTSEELDEERRLHRLYESEANGKPVEEWPRVLRERDFSLPTKYGVREPVGWFAHGL